MSIGDRLFIDEIKIAKCFGDLVFQTIFDEQTGDAPPTRSL
jgi:hypothetical protein